jgi:hypothetical protein
MSDLPLDLSSKPLGGLFHGPNGDVSMKRFFGFCCLGMAIYLSFVHPEGWQLIGSWLGGATAVFIAQAISRT